MHACTHARTLAHPYICKQRARYARLRVWSRSHARFGESGRARVLVTRASWRACRRRRGRLALSRLSVARLVATRASLATYVPSCPVPRQSGRRPEGSSLRRAEWRHGLSSHRHAASPVFPLYPPFACLPTTARRLGVFRSSSSTSPPTHAVVSSHTTCRRRRRRRLFARVCETGRLKADARMEPDDPYRVPRRAMRRSAREARLLSHGLVALRESHAI